MKKCGGSLGVDFESLTNPLGGRCGGRKNVRGRERCGDWDTVTTVMFGSKRCRGAATGHPTEHDLDIDLLHCRCIF